MKTDLLSFTLILHRFNYVSMVYRCSYNLDVTVTESFSVANIAMSSANVLIVVTFVVGIYDVYRRPQDAALWDPALDLVAVRNGSINFN